MKKNIIIVILLFIFIISIIINIFLYNVKFNYNITEVKDGSIESCQHIFNGYVPDGGYVPDAKTAVKIADAILENMDMEGGEYIVEYDKASEIWIVHKARILKNGAYIIINQMDGKIIEAWKTK